MFRQLKVKIGTLEKNIYLRTGVTRFSNEIAPIHRHGAAEVHVVAEGTVTFHVGEELCTVTAGEIFVVPPMWDHVCAEASPGNRYANFYVDVPLDAPVRFRAADGIAAAFIDEYAEGQEKDDYTKLAAFVLLLCCEFCRWDTVHVEKLSDRAVVIDDYFANHYVDGTLSDLAAELCLSEKQTQRLVLQRTGMTFRQNMAKGRVRAAELLGREGKLSAQEIAEYVGYASYAGFYKAMQRYGEKNETV